MSRSEHLAWAKTRAIELAEQGDIPGAFSSIVSDLGKHPETVSSRDIAIQLGGQMLLSGMLNHPRDMKNFIEGFN